ncbi:MAG TPA: IS481 family transposase [Gallionella sp.]|nr:IS481 family transposase [Gallionella sp.]
MPWKVSGVVEERGRFVLDYETGLWTMAELCRQYGIARKTGYKILERWEQERMDGLQDRSRAPLRHPNQTPAAIEDEVIELRRAHMSWGPRKLRRWLETRYPQRSWPAPSTMGELLKREGLINRTRVRRKTPPYTQPFAHAGGPNQVWCIDFKGWFLAQDGSRIDPLTITDAYSRYLLRCQAVAKTDTEQVRAICEAAFREYGLPQAMRSDNGSPFASRGVAGLSRLSLYWMKLGIVPERIEPGHPEQNGRHERMHRTLKAETATPAAANRRQQQRAFNCFRREYNEERPHEALGLHTPASCYEPSPRPYPDRVNEPEYDTGFEVRRVHTRGQFLWKRQGVFLGKALAGERIGLEPVDDRYWRVYFATVPIAWFDTQQLLTRPLPHSDGQQNCGGNMEISKPEIPTFPPHDDCDYHVPDGEQTTKLSG